MWHGQLRVPGLAVPFGRDAPDGLGSLREGRADEVADETVEVGVLASCFLFKQMKDLVRHLPLYRIECFFAGQTLVEDKVSSDTLGEWPAFHGSRIAWAEGAPSQERRRSAGEVNGDVVPFDEET